MAEETTLPNLSICVITHSTRSRLFGKFLASVRNAIENYSGEVELVVINNSGQKHRQEVESQILTCGFNNLCEYSIYDSIENNIAVGRNLAMQNAVNDWVVFIDDDETPVKSWLRELVHTMRKYDAKIVAGPILPVFPDDAADWVKTVDVHNVENLFDGDKLSFAATGNVMLHMPSIGTAKFNKIYGSTGGSDTDFFLRISSRKEPVDIIWSSEAVVYEEITHDRSTPTYMIRRFLSQGSNFKKIMAEHGLININALFYLKAAAVGTISFLFAVPMVAFRTPMAGRWMKRAFSNLGKIYDPTQNLYG